MVIDVIVHLPQGVLRRIAIRETTIDRFRRRGVRSIGAARAARVWRSNRGGASDKSEALRAEWYSRSCKTRQSIGNAYRGIPNRNGCRGVNLNGIAHGIHPRFKRTKIKELVLDDMSARTSAILFQFHRRLSLQGAVRIEVIEEIARIKRVRAAKSISRAVYLICSGLQSDTRDRSRFPTEFRLGIDLCVEFLDSIDRQDRCGIAGNRSCIRYAESHKRFVIAQTIDEVAGILRPGAVRS